MGQKIGDGDARSSPVHATVSGTVTAIEEREIPGGERVKCVIIKNDGKDTPAPMAGHADWQSISAKEVAELVRECGIVGMGGAAFPTNSKIASTAGKTADVLINACECEPYITSDDTEMCCFTEDVIGGARMLCKLLGAKSSIIAIEDNKPEAIEALRAALTEDDCVEVRVLPTRYPQGAKKQLILAVTGKEVAPGARSGALFNVTTTANVYRAVTKGQPLLEKIVTVTGDGVNEPKNMLVRIGTSFADVIKAAGGHQGGDEAGHRGRPHDGQGRRHAGRARRQGHERHTLPHGRVRRGGRPRLQSAAASAWTSAPCTSSRSTSTATPWPATRPCSTSTTSTTAWNAAAAPSSAPASSRLRRPSWKPSICLRREENERELHSYRGSPYKE